MLINEDIVFRHAQDAAFFWTQRSEALAENKLDHEARTELDSRVDANLDGLYIDRDAGVRIATELRTLYPEPGEVFGCAVLAAYAESEEPFVKLWADVADEASRAAFVSALGWHQYRHVRPVLRGLVGAGDASLVALGLSGHGVHRQAPEGPLERFFGHTDVGVRAGAVRLAGELGRVELGADLRSLLGGALRLEAALSLALLGIDQPDVRASLRAAAADDGSWVAACRLVNLNPLRAQEEIRELIRRGFELAAIHAISALGDGAFAPALIDWMDDDRWAAAARGAFTALTGLDDAKDLERKQARTGPSSAPVSSSAAEAWQANQARFEANTRYIAGKPVGSLKGGYSSSQLEALEDLVRTARPLERMIAASCMASCSPTRPLPEVRAFASPGHELPGMMSNPPPGAGGVRGG
jgi:uncharacterized protein (TIGR02270 family)